MDARRGASLASRRATERVLPENELRSRGRTARIRSATISLGLDFVDDLSDLLPVSFRGEMLPAGKRTEGHRATGGEVPRSEFQASPSGLELQRAIEPHSLERRPVEQGIDAVHPGHSPGVGKPSLEPWESRYRKRSICALGSPVTESPGSDGASRGIRGRPTSRARFELMKHIASRAGRLRKAE